MQIGTITFQERRIYLILSSEGIFNTILIIILKLSLGVVELKSNENFIKIEEQLINNKIDREISIKIQSQIGWTEEWYSSMNRNNSKS